MKKKERINLSIVLANLSAGGAERVLSFIAQELDESKFNVTLVVFGKEENTVYNVENVNVIYFEKTRVLNGVFNLLKYLQKNKPDIVLSAVAHVNTLVAYASIFFPKTKFIAREVTLLSVAKTVNNSKKGPFDYFVNRRFNFFDKIICQSEAMYHDINKHSKIDQSKFVIINNPITDGFKPKSRNKIDGSINLITVGSFKKVKGHLRIIEALGKVKFPFNYTLIGDGTEKKDIFDLISDYGLNDRITHIPFTDNVGKYLSESDLFLQGSYTEGFPNALIESCAVGVPVLAFSSPGGHNEIIIEHVNGYLVDDEEYFIKKLTEINENYNFVIEEVSESANSRYGKNVILEKYESLFLDLINQKN